MHLHRLKNIATIFIVISINLFLSPNAFSLEEPPGSQSVEEAIAAEKNQVAENQIRYQSTYQSYAVKPHETAIILMHGKWGGPPAPLHSNFEVEKFRVISPLMPWAGVSAYDKTYEQALSEVNMTVLKLRADGYKKIIIGGQSFGANGALAYAAVYGDIDGLLLFAPGHNPDIDRNNQPGLVSDARKNIKDGKPEQLITFSDFNDGGRYRAMEARSDVFYSFFNEDGLANMQESAKKIKKSIPTIVFMGGDDFITRKGSGYFFDRLPKNEMSRYRVSRAGHREVPMASFNEALAWVQNLIK
jgi:pimeloyl-ACP methyl ester carboxylesterase